MVGGFHGVLLLSEKHSRSLVWWEDTTWKAVRNALRRTSNTVWSVHWSNITLFLRKTNLNCINSAQKSCRENIIWICVAPGEHLERRHYGCRHWRIGGDGRIRTPRQTAQCKGSVNAAKKWKLHIPCRRCKGKNQRLRTSTLIRDRPERGEEQEVLRGESDGLSSPNPLQDDSTRDDAEAKHDFWSITGDFIYRHHVEPRVKLYVPREESFRILLKYIDVTRNTHASSDVFFGQIDDYWNVDGEKELSDAWAGFSRFVLLKERPTEG